ncbi:nuclear transport factor 2 family protein [Rhodococcus opacus]|uniref:nuclear transport factor 2 family protein n=1 Tax=Rhodococcus opacus TaxID=37919 RepID=UPI001FF271B2|nr:nuclear transport factor 2 family protein [Rhodococcus opacus]UOT03259.1 nuclear transport factor 2 family protein [Rhodococcus opacus]
MHPTETAIRALYTAWNTRDLTGWIGAFTPDATWTNTPTGEVFTGPDGMRENYTNWNIPFPEGQCEDITVLVGDGFAVGQFMARGINTGPLATDTGQIPATGRTLSVPFCDIHTLEGGLITATVRYWDQSTVAHDLGLL